MAARRQKVTLSRTNVSEVERLIRGLRLDDRGAALAQVARTLATRLDASEPREAAAIARMLTEVIERLAPPAADDDDDDWTAPTPT